MGNILLICAVFSPEEVTTAGMSLDLALALSKRNNVTVLHPRPTRPAGVDYTGKNLEFDEFKSITVNSYTCPHSKLFKRFWESTDFGIRSAVFILKNRKAIDYVFNDSWHLFGQFIVSVACKLSSIPYMAPIQDVYPESLLTKGINSRLAKFLVKNILFPLDYFTQKHAQIIRTNTNEMASYLSETRKINLEKYLVVYNWQNENDFNIVENNTECKKRVFSYVGSINVHSNVDLIIKAFAKAGINNSEIRVYGGGNKCEECKELSKQLNMENITFGYVSRSDVPKIQSEADIMLFALPTGNGKLCLPSKMVSYMLSARPILASIDTDCSASNILKESGCGVVVEPDNLEKLVEGFKTISAITDEELIHMGERAREFAQRVLSKDVNLKKVVDVIDNFLDNVTS